MFYLILGYLFLFVFRPYEVWPFLAAFRIERVYMFMLLAAVLSWNKKRYISHPINNAVIGFFMVILAASTFAFNSSEAFPVAFEYFKLLVFYFIIILTIQDEKELKTFILAYVLIMSLYVGKSAWEFFVNGRMWFRMGIVRMMGIDITYSDPNYFAGSIVYSLPFLWAMIKAGFEERWLKLVLWGYGVLSLVCIIYTGSRSGMVTALLFFILVWLGSAHKMKGLILLPVLLVFMWTTMPESYKIRFETIFVEGLAEESGQKGADNSAEGRIAGLKTGFSTFLSKPLFGIGPGNFKYAWSGGTGEVTGGSAHNMYGQVLGELGGVGFCSFFLLVGLIFATHRRIRKTIDWLLEVYGETLSLAQTQTLKHMHLIATGSIQMLILLLFNGNFGHNLYRFNYLWLGAIGVLGTFFLDNFRKNHALETEP